MSTKKKYVWFRPGDFDSLSFILFHSGARKKNEKYLIAEQLETTKDKALICLWSYDFLKIHFLFVLQHIQDGNITNHLVYLETHYV